MESQGTIEVPTVSSPQVPDFDLNTLMIWEGSSSVEPNKVKFNAALLTDPQEDSDYIRALSQSERLHMPVEFSPYLQIDGWKGQHISHKSKRIIRRRFLDLWAQRMS